MTDPRQHRSPLGAGLRGPLAATGVLVVLVGLSALHVARQAPGQSEQFASAPSWSPHGDIRFDCQLCHDTRGWAVSQSPVGFDHGKTGFPLAGRHRQARGRDCHGDLVFSHVASACADCHVDPHRGQLGMRCESCHTAYGWESAVDLRARHADRGFPLAGVHAVVDCEACHRDRRRDEYALTSSRCYDCHAGDFVAAREPEHLQSGFSTDCETCHRPAPGWRSSNFAHPDRFPLVGTHATLACVDCHAGGYSGTPAQCIGCHAADYAGTSDPAHGAAGFPTTCETRHTTTAWEPSSWDHSTLFPI